MRDAVEILVIGGGVVGCSVLYHLTKAGRTDLMLLERDELTSGSTWHAAGGMHTLNGDPNVAKLQQYTIGLYQELERVTGQSCGIHLTGGVMLADTADRLDWLKTAHAKGRYLGMQTEIIGTAEAKRLFPLLEERHFVGAMFDPVEGHVDPAGVTQAYAKAARMAGAEIQRKTRVEALLQRADGGWEVRTTAGTVMADHVVNAGGLWAREVGRMVGIELPVLAMEHMYLLTEDMPEVADANAALGREMIHAIDFGGELYLRQERGGMLMGTYEQACRPWSPKSTPWDFGHELLEPDLDRIAPSLEVGFSHFPAFEHAGIRQVINGPFTFAPDGNPLIGPVPGLRNFWSACAVMAGFSQGGGVGLALANWITEGDPGFDVFGMDVARFGLWATPAYTQAKVKENYSRRFRIRYPNEELPAGRPLRTTPIHDRLLQAGAVMGASFGLETPLWFAEPGEEDVFSFRRATDHAAVGRECQAVRDGVGLSETSAFAKYEITGTGAEAWLRLILAGKMPATGRLTLCPMLNANGRLIGDFTLAKEGEDRFLLFGSGIAERYHTRWFEQHLPPDATVRVRPLGLNLAGLAIAGPRSRELLGRITEEDVGGDTFPFLAFRSMDLGMIRARVGRISFTGDLGYEFWVAPDQQHALLDLLQEAGSDLGLTWFGARALNSLRLDKSYGSWAREYRPIYGPFEAGLGGFLDLAREGFSGREAAFAEQERGPERRLVTLVIDAADADAIGDEPISHGGEVVGWVTSGGYAHHLAASVALGYIKAELAGDTGKGAFEVEILGEQRPATLKAEPLFDPKGERMRG
jgi:dimethylglycine dehydrogenase